MDGMDMVKGIEVVFFTFFHSVRLKGSFVTHILCRAVVTGDGNRSRAKLQLNLHALDHHRRVQLQILTLSLNTIA